MLGARKSAGELTAGEEKHDQYILAHKEHLEAWEVQVELAKGQRAPWLDPLRGRKRPHRPRLDQLERRMR